MEREGSQEREVVIGSNVKLIEYVNFFRNKKTFSFLLDLFFVYLHFCVIQIPNNIENILFFYKF